MRIHILFLLAFSLSNTVFSKEKIQIVKPLVELEVLTVGETTYDADAATPGSLHMAFVKKKNCIEWVEDAVEKLREKKSHIFSAECEQDFDPFTNKPKDVYKALIKFF